MTTSPPPQVGTENAGWGCLCHQIPVCGLRHGAVAKLVSKHRAHCTNGVLRIGFQYPRSAPFPLAVRLGFAPNTPLPDNITTTLVTSS